MFKIERTIGAGHLGADGKLTIGKAIDLLQDCSCFQLEAEPVLSEYFHKNNIGMFLTSRQLDISRMPLCGEKATVATSIYKVNQIYGFRNTMIYDDKGNVCVASCASGAFVSLSEGTIVKCPEEVLNTVPLDKPCNMEYLPRKISVPSDGGKPCEHFPIRRYHIDANRHVNNARYAEIAAEFLPDNFSPCRVRLDYKAPAKYGDVIAPIVYDKGGEIIVVLEIVGGKTSTVVSFTEKSAL